MTAQGDPAVSDATSLDFWLGRWSCRWDGGEGRNRISKELEGRVVVERFESLSPERWSGMSLSVFDERDGRWRQTWVDSTGNYWAFTEGRDGDRLTFETTDVDVDQAGERRTVEKRMVFFDIEPHSFTWRWERSLDGGVTWGSLWTIDYRREAGRG